MNSAARLLAATCMALVTACGSTEQKAQVDAGVDPTTASGNSIDTGFDSSEPPVPDTTALPELTFYLVAYRRDRMRLFWHEWPHYADNRLTLGTPLADCKQQVLYANSAGALPQRVSHRGTRLIPQRLRNTAEELAPWDELPEDSCSVLITAGYWIEDAFMGLSLSTRDGVFRRVPARMPMEPAEAGEDLQNLRGVREWVRQNFPEDWTDRQVTVSFDFPRGRRTAVTLSLTDAAATLDGPYYRTTDWEIAQPWNSVRFWARAALARLELDFREQAESESGDVRSTVLTAVEGVRGAWWFDTQDGRDVTSALDTPIQGASHIRFQVE